MNPLPNLRSATAALLLAGCLLGQPGIGRAQTLAADYQVQDVYSSSAGTIGDLTVVGDSLGATFQTAIVGTQTQQVLNLATRNTGAAATTGVQTQTAGFGVDLANYSAVLLADFDLTATGVVATKIMDFKNLSSDAGLYVSDSTGALSFIDGSGASQGIGASGAVTSGTYLQIVLTRNSTTALTSIYADGALAFSFTDTTSLATLGDASATGNAFLTLFKDDGMGLGGAVVNEASLGDIARLRLYDGVLTPAEVAALDTTIVPEPATSALLSAASALLLGGSLLRRRRRTAA